MEIVTQDFNMNAFLQGDIDAAQAMTYNEYAQVLETVNPDTGELYQPEDFNVIAYEDTEGGHAAGRDLGRHRASSRATTAYADTTVAFLKAVIKGWAYARDNVEAAAEITVDGRLRPGDRATSCGWPTRPTS